MFGHLRPEALDKSEGLKEVIWLSDSWWPGFQVNTKWSSEGQYRRNWSIRTCDGEGTVSRVPHRYHSHFTTHEVRSVISGMNYLTQVGHPLRSWAGIQTKRWWPKFNMLSPCSTSVITGSHQKDAAPEPNHSKWGPTPPPTVFVEQNWLERTRATYSLARLTWGETES